LIALIDAGRTCGICKYVGTNFHKGSYYCKPCANAKARKWHAANITNPEVKRRKKSGWVKHKHGITLDEYEAKLIQQGMQCAICKISLSLNGTLTHLDHNHSTGNLRDFLCTNCNRGLGHFQDSKELLLMASEYLERHK